MKKALLLAMAAVLLLAGCGKAPQSTEQVSTTAATTTEIPETTEASVPPKAPANGQFYIQEEIYYNDEGKELARMTVEVDAQGLPVTIFMDSGSDITYKPTYDDEGNILCFERIWTVYGQDTVSYAEVNQHGDITKQISSQGTEEEQTYQTTYTYDQQGRIIKEESTRDGQADHTEILKYDEHGNVTYQEELFHMNTARNYVAQITNTYENGLLVEKKSVVDGGMETNITTYTYDENGLLVKESFNDQFITEYTYNDQGLLTEKSVNGVATRYTYDENGRLHEKFENGNRIVYVWAQLQKPMTASQLKLFTQFGIIPK